MKRFNKRPTEGAVARLLDAYRTDMNPAPIAGIACRHSIRDYAHEHGLRTNDVTHSFRRMLKAVPSIGDHVEGVRRANVYGGPSFIDYRLDDVGLLAWLYWREVKGRLPEELFGGRKRDE